MAEEVDPLRSLFLKLSERLKLEEDRSLYGLVRDRQISTKGLTGLTNANELFIKLEELGHIGNENLTLLKNLLREIKREPLVSLVEEFERKQQAIHSISQQHDINKDVDQFQLEPLVQSVEECETRQHDSQSISQQHRNQNAGQQDWLNTNTCSKMTSIFLAERWSHVWDAVSALNCQLTSLAAQNRQKKICCVVLKASEEEKEDAADCGVDLICLNEDIDGCEYDEPSFKWLLSPYDYFSTLTKLQNVAYIVEHVKSSTSFLSSLVLRERCFKAADIVLINHTSPPADLKYKFKHLKFAEAAGAVFSVGPTVFEEYKKLYEWTEIPIKHAVYLPRPENAFFDLRVDQMSRTDSLKQILTVVTDKKIESTRFEVLSAAIEKTTGLLNSIYQAIPTWFARIVSGINLNFSRDFLRNKCSYIDVNTYPPYGSLVEIFRDLQQSNVLVIPPDEPFRMEALWAIAAGLPVSVPRTTAMAKFLEYCFGNQAEYFLYKPDVDDLSNMICKMLNSTETIGVTRQLKDALRHHSEIKGTHENFKNCLAKTSQPNVLPGPDTATAAVSPTHRHSTDDGIGSIEDASYQQSLSPQPVPAAVSPSHSQSTDDVRIQIEYESPQQSTSCHSASPESSVFPHVASTSHVQGESIILTKMPLMPTIRAEAELEILDEKVEDTAHPTEERRKQIELLKDKNEELYELQKKKIMTGTSPDLVKQLDEACIMFKARLEGITEGSLQFMLSFLSEEDIDYFWQKYMAVDVQEVISSILITREMRLLAEKAGCSVKIRLKIDEKEYEIVKEILHDISAVYTFSKKTWFRTVAFNHWERYVLNHVHENQAEYLIQQSRFHPILSEFGDDEFFFPSFVSYWYESTYNLPSTLTEATEYAIKHHVQLYCKERKLKFRNVWDVVQGGLYEFGKQAFDNYPQTPSSFLQFDDSCDRTFFFDLLNDVKRYHIFCFLERPLHSGHFWRQHIYFYALALYLSNSKNALLRRVTFEKCVKSIPNILIFVAGILKEKSTFFFILLTFTICKSCHVDIELLSLLGCCLSESKCPAKFIAIVQHLMKPQSLDLSTSDFDHISHYCLESIASMLEQTSIVEKLVLVAKNEMSSLSDSFKSNLKFQMDNPNCDVEFQINNMVELTIVARFIKFHELLRAQRSVRHLSQTTLKSIAIKATENISYNESYRTGQILIRALAKCSYLKLFHLSGFKKTFITSILQTIIIERTPLTMTRMELPQNELDNSSVSIILDATKCFPLLEELDIRNNNLGCAGSVALLPLADKVNVFIENNGVGENLDRLFNCKEVSEQIRHRQPYMSGIKTIADIKILQRTLEEVTQLHKSSPEKVVLLCSSLSLFTNLKELDFSACDITEDYAIVIADQFDYLSELAHVNLSSNNIGDLGVHCVASKLDNLNSFRSADFSRTNISLRGMIDLHRTVHMSQHENINVAHNLTELVYVLPYIQQKLSNYPVDVDLQAKRVTLDKLRFIMELDKAGKRVSISKNLDKTEFKHICKGLSILYMVRYLDLSHGNIGEVGAGDFRKVMEWLPLLSHLSLTHNNIGDTTARNIARGVRKLTNLSSLDLSNNNIQEFGAMKVIRAIGTLNKLRNLYLSHNNIHGFGSEIVNEGTENVSALEDLNLSNNAIGNEGAESLSTVMEWFPQLKYLYLSHNNIGDDGAGRIGKGVTKMTNLRHLDLGNNKIHNFGAASVVKAIGKLYNLKSIDLSHNYIQSFDAKIVAEGDVNVYALEDLDLSNNSIGNEGAESLTTVMEWLPQLEYLSLRHNKIGDDGALSIGKGVTKLTNLNDLDLSNNKIQKFGATSILRGIGILNDLRTLNLSDNNIQGFDAQIVSEGIVNVCALEDLDLSDNNIGDEGAESLSTVLEWFPQLKYLSLSHNNIGDDRAKRLIRGIVKLTHGHAFGKVMQLKYLDLHNNCITDSGAHFLKSTIKTVGLDLFVDLGESEIGNVSQYSGKKPTRRYDKTPRTAVSSTSVIDRSSIRPNYYSETAASHSDSGLGRSSFQASTGSDGGKVMPFMKHDFDSSSATSGMGDFHSSAVTGGPVDGKKHSSKTAASHSDSALGLSSFPTYTYSIGGKEGSFKELDIDSSSATSGMGISHSSAKSKEGLDLESDLQLDV